MRIRFFSVILLAYMLLLGCSVFAWERQSDTTLLINFRGGINYGNISGFPTQPERIFGKNFELIMTLHPNQEYSFNAGFGYIQKGFIAEGLYSDIYGTAIGYYPTNYDFDYLNIPLTLQYNLGRKKFNIYITGGLDVNFLLSHRRSADLPDRHEGVEVEPFDEDFSGLCRGVVFGFHYGIGLEYKIYPAFSVLADVKFRKDFSNAYLSNVPLEFKHTATTFNLGVKIGIPIRFVV